MEEAGEKAGQQIELARERHAIEVANSIKNGGTLPPSRLRQARIDLAEAEDRLEGAQSALSGLVQSLTSTEEELGKANSTVSEAAKAVLAAETKDHLSERERLKDEFVSKVASLDWLVRSKIIEDYDPKQNQPFVHHDPYMRKGSASEELLRSLGLGSWAPTWLSDLDRHSAVQTWKDALERLQRDPDEFLPRG
jgi:hypothetical protein